MNTPSTLFILHIFGYWLSIKDGISRIGINIVFSYSSEEYFLFPLILKQYSPCFLPCTHYASHDIHFSIKALMFILSNFLRSNSLITWYVVWTFSIFSNMSKQTRIGSHRLYFVNSDAFIINDLRWIHHVFVFSCNFSMINTWTLCGNSQKNSIKLSMFLLMVFSEVCKGIQL
jgi:hypothetical protein